MKERQPEWYENYANVVAVARILVEEEGWDAPRLIRFLEKPWKWGEKWDEVLRRRG
jgi:hypothetical protein